MEEALDELEDVDETDTSEKICRKKTKNCSNENCANVLPESGKGSRKCSVCGTHFTTKVKYDESQTKDTGTKYEKAKRQDKSLDRRLNMFKHHMKEKHEISLANVDHNHSKTAIKLQGTAMEGNPASYESVKNHTRQFASFVRVKKYVESDPSHDGKDNPLEREWFYIVVDGKPKLLILGLQESCYRCEICGYKVAIGSSFEALVNHLHEVHDVDPSTIQKDEYDDWREFDYP